METDQKKPLVISFHVHQPRRLRRVGFLDIGNDFDYFNDTLNEDVIKTIAHRCYLPVTHMLTKVCKELEDVRISFSISGIALMQFERYVPDVMQSFRALVDTGCVELLGETSHHSLACVMANDEFPNQVQEHAQLLERHFNVRPTIFRNTGLIYDNNIGARVAQLGFKGILCDDVDEVLMHKSHYATYHHPTNKDLTILLRNNTLSDDISFRFITGTGKLDIDRYFKALESAPGIVTLAVDYETFGEHQDDATGITGFLRQLITKATQSDHLKLMTPSEALSNWRAEGQLDVPNYTSWADESKDLSAWLGNEIQNEAFALLHGLEGDVKKLNNHDLLDVWRNLQTSDHFYYMSTKTGPDGEVNSHFSPYHSPYEAFINYMNILHDFKLKLQHTQSHNQMESVENERRHEHGPVWAEKAQADYLTSR
jgi:alpha-amylase